TKTYGGSAGDIFSWITPATDGGYIIAGATTSSDGDVSGQHGRDDAWLMKIDENGNTLWQKAMGGSSQDVFTSVIPSNDGGYIAVGNTTSTDGDATGRPLRSTDVWVVKTDAAGDKVWAKYYGGSGFDHAVSVVAGPGGGYAVCGLTRSNDGDVSGNHGGFADVWVFKKDEAGGKQWQKTLGTSDADQGFSITAAGDGYVVLGSVAGNDGDVTANHGMNDYWLVKLDASGGKVWQKTYGGSGSDAPYVLKASSDGGYILCGSSNSTDGDLTGNKGGLDLWMLKVDAGGGKVWSKTFGGASDDYAKSFIPTPDNGYLIAGYSKSNDADVSGNHGDWDGWLVRINVQ
ncbi:MAG: hypothetical protein M3342_13405, partial [Bacteroidota bacterium]|nr:hypothetical protein [Bacteroidota bacterium]